MKTKPRTDSDFAMLVESFLSDRMLRQRGASRKTVESYRDTFILLLAFLQRRLKKAPSDLMLSDLDAPLVAEFLDHLEKERGNSPRTRNLRLTAIRSFYRYAALRSPEHSGRIGRILAIPPKRYDRRQVEYLTPTEIKALLATPDVRTRAGRRDHALLTLAIQTGLRISEFTALRNQDLHADGPSRYVHCLGKGRKERDVPLTRQTAMTVKAWTRDRQGNPSSLLFTSARGEKLSQDGVQYLLDKHLKAARELCPSLEGKRVSPHVLRHTFAMEALHAGISMEMVALLMGHESIETTMKYVKADLEMKEKILSRLSPRKGRTARFRADDRLMAFLKRVV